jgi:hypothetical protein
MFKPMMGIALALLLMGGCAKQPVPTPKAAAPVANGTAASAAVRAGALPFRAGVSSVTVERMGRAQACPSSQGASLMTEPGPVEVYKMVCDSGRIYMARCELRQCRPM